MEEGKFKRLFPASISSSSTSITLVLLLLICQALLSTSFPAVIVFHHQLWCHERLQARFIARRRFAPAQPDSAPMRHNFDFWFDFIISAISELQFGIPGTPAHILRLDRRPCPGNKRMAWRRPEIQLHRFLDVMGFAASSELDPQRVWSRLRLRRHFLRRPELRPSHDVGGDSTSFRSPYDPTSHLTGCFDIKAFRHP
ncbi:hypothetical protein ACFE04_022437 [Oxalis oulophora]